MAQDKRIAVLIDADNVSEKYIRPILVELSNHGMPTYKRIYGDFTSSRLAAWKSVLLDNSITPIQQYSYTTGKNATDAALIIDAMDILYSGNVDGFCIVSSDSDFTKLAARLREAGMYVIGMGEKKTPTAFISACEKFKYLEVLVPVASVEEAPVSKQVKKAPPAKTKQETPKDKVEPTKGAMASIESIAKAIKKIVNENSDEDNWISLSEVGNILNKRYPDFDSRNYGHAKLSNLIKSLVQFEVELRNTNPFIRIKG